jgi:hypothetical protein
MLDQHFDEDTTLNKCKSIVALWLLTLWISFDEDRLTPFLYVMSAFLDSTSQQLNKIDLVQ